MAEIGTMVEQLAGYRIDGGVTYPPLLKSLRQAVWGDIGRTQSGAGSSSSIPIDPTAFKHWTELQDEIGGAYSQWSGLPPTPSTIVNLHAWHTAFVAAVERGEADEIQVATMKRRLEEWVTRVTAFFDAPPVVELDIACPHCGQVRARWYSKDIEAEIESMALAVTFSAEGMYAVCRTPGCTDTLGEKSRWDGPDEITYMARRAGINVDDLADKIRDAKTPIAEKPWVQEVGKVTVGPEDPTYLEQIALLNGGAA